MKKMNERLKALEKESVSEVAFLAMPDGSTVPLNVSPGNLKNLYCGSRDGAVVSKETVAELDLIRRSVATQEPGGARLVMLLRALLLSPAEPEVSEAAALA